MIPRGQNVLDGRNMRVSAYLVEMHSLPGFSGSPVFLRIQAGSYRGPSSDRPTGTDYSLLGIDTGHKLNPVRLMDRRTGKPLESLGGESLENGYIEGNSGLAIVAPSSHLMDIIDSADLVAQRDATDAEWHRRHEHELASSDAAADETRPKRDMDQRVSLQPLVPEDALRGLLATPPPEDQS